MFNSMTLKIINFFELMNFLSIDILDPVNSSVEHYREFYERERIKNFFMTFNSVCTVSWEVCFAIPFLDYAKNIEIILFFL